MEQLPREHPAYPAFKAWADLTVPGQMLTVYWACWLAGGAAALLHLRKEQEKGAAVLAQRDVEKQAAALQDRPRPDIVPKEVALRYRMPCGAGPMHATDAKVHVATCPTCIEQEATADLSRFMD